MHKHSQKQKIGSSLSTAVNPCDLLTKKEVENALSGDFGSVTVVDVEIEKDQPRCVCWYSYYEGGKAGRHHSVGVYYSRGKKALEMLEWVKERTRKGSTIYDPETESISDLGDEAYWTGGNRLVVRVKDSVLEIYPLPPYPLPSKEIGIKMAKIAIQRIK
ncbi:hypothetical protein JGI3_00070 [Candidatus Kryptobacter tengchongensis]|nr:hypothetical protein JGI3_00070 [Candidatus Kryptobacter tengchongensis]